jgi:exonuclease III
MRVATWNMKQAVAPRKPLDELWAWAERSIAPDVVVLTEAKVPAGGPPPGWDAVWIDGGIGPGRRWGTVIAGRGVELKPVDQVTVGRFRRRAVSVTSRQPAAALATDVLVNGKRWATVVGLYGLTTDLDGNSCGHGGFMTPALLHDLSPLFSSDRRDRIIVAGDFNLHPRNMRSLFSQLGLMDLTSMTRSERQPLEGCTGCDSPSPEECGHLWTHKNGSSENATRQQIDFILATVELARELDQLTGGISDYPDAWEVSDHAPVVADFRS